MKRNYDESFPKAREAGLPELDLNAYRPVLLLESQLGWTAAAQWSSPDYLKAAVGPQTEVEVCCSDDRLFCGVERVRESVTLKWKTFVDFFFAPQSHALATTGLELYLCQCPLFSKTTEPVLAALLIDCPVPACVPREAVTDVW